MATDYVLEAQQLRGKLVERKAELLAELEEVETLLDSFDGVKSTPRRRATSSGTNRADAFIALVGENPDGITVAQAAKKMKMGPNYLYRVAGHLAKEGKVIKEKDGPNFFPVKADSKADSKAQDESQDEATADTNGTEAVPTF